MGRKLKLIGFLLFFSFAVSTATFFQPATVAGGEEGVQKRKAPSFSVETLENNTVSLDNYRGKVLLLDFFVSWCRPCKDGALELREVRENFSSENLALLSVESDPNVPIEDVENFKSKYGGDWPFAKAPKVADKYGVEGYPTIFVVTPDGYIAENMEGAVSSDVLSRIVAGLLGTSKPVENQLTNVIIDVSTDPENAGGIVATDLKINETGEPVFTYEVRANPGYEFVGWTGDVPENQKDNRTLEIIPTLGTKLTANFAPLENVQGRGGATGPSGGIWGIFGFELLLGIASGGCLGVLACYFVWGRPTRSLHSPDRISCTKKTAW